MVTSSNKLATAVGVEVLKKGGNAVDAAVAVALALAVTHPAAGNLGGGGFMLVRMADGRVSAIDYREMAPAAAHAKLYLDAKGEIIPKASTLGYRAAGVPGTVAGLELALSKYGTVKWAELVEPARKLAAEGFLVSHGLAENLKRGKNTLEPFPESKRIFLHDGKMWNEGDRLVQPELARTLARLQKDGPREFYEGETAKLIAADMKTHDGLITLEDLKSYKPAEREALRGHYRGFEIITMPPPSSGGATLLQMLNVLQNDDLASLGYSSAAADHLVIEAMRRAFADRASFFGDPDFTSVPVASLISLAYAKKQRAAIDAVKATPSAQIAVDRPVPTESDHTTHFTVVDKDGNVVSNTYTLNLLYGSGVTVKDAGILLNNEMDDFTSKPGVPNAFGLIQGEKNAIAAHKRPLSSMTPTIVLKDNQFFMALGSPGGPTIINSVLQTLLNVIDFHMDLQSAVDAPRFHMQWQPDEVVYEPRCFSPDTEALLRSRGYNFRSTLETKAPSPTMGDVEAVMIEPGTGVRLGAADPRNEDSAALGY